MLILVVILIIATVVLSPFLVALILMFPHASVVYRRRRMIKYITHTAEKQGFCVTPLHRLVCLSPNRGARYDILVQNRERAYAIKLWSFSKKQSTVVISKDGTVCEYRRVPEPLSPNTERNYSIRGKKRNVPVTEQNFKIKKDKPVEFIMMYYPRNKDTFLDFGTHKKRLENGDRVFGKTVCSPTGFCKLLEEQNVSQDCADNAQNETVQ